MSRRVASYVPVTVRARLDRLSKSDLMELVWDYALTSVGDSMEDASFNEARILDIQGRSDAVKQAR